MQRIVLYSSLLIMLLGLVSCSATKAEKVVNAIDTALYHLSQGTPDCQKAIDALEDVGMQGSNPRYMQTLASAYACRGGFSELTLFDEISTIDSSALLGSLAQLSSSTQTEAESSDFTDLQTAIDLLLYSNGRTTPSATQMKVIYGDRHGTNLNLQAAYMILVQLGRYVYWYGNTNASGVKGGGSQGNTCFFDYSGTALTVATTHGGGNACTASNSGSDDLDYTLATTTVAKKRLCQGVMLLNNLIDILSNTTLSDNDALGDLSNLSSSIQTYVDAAELLDPAMPAFIANLSQSSCETTVTSSDSLAQLYFASLFEGGLP